MIQLKVTMIGNSAAVILPQEVLAKLNVQKGETLILTESPEGFVLTPYDATFERQMGSAEKIVNRYRDALRELAK